MERKRVVVTGMGILCPTGNSIEEAWLNTSRGQSGIDFMKRVDTSRIANHIMGEVKNFDPNEVFGKREARRMDRCMQLGLAAARQAMEDSGLIITDENAYQVACIIGSGVGGIETTVEADRNLIQRGHKGVSPFAVPMMLSDSTAARVSIDFGIRGPNYCIVTACATGNNAIGEAAEKIRYGHCIAAIAGGTESAFVEVAIAGFNNMTALSSENENPQQVSRPFDLHRNGFVMGEGAGILVLEELEHALARGAKIYGEVRGYGSTSDAHHATAPMETGEGAYHAMKFAIQDAGIEPSQIDYVNAHGTSTKLNDKAETQAIKKALGEHAYRVNISSTKSVTGHLLGAAGAVEAIFSLMAIKNNFVPPTINLTTPDPDCDLDYTPNQGVTREIKTVMSNAFGFGGHNAVLILGEYTHYGKAY